MCTAGASLLKTGPDLNKKVIFIALWCSACFFLSATQWKFVSRATKSVLCILFQGAFSTAAELCVYLILIPSDLWTPRSVVSVSAHRSWALVCSYPFFFRLLSWHFLSFLFLISSSLCCICPFVTPAPQSPLLKKGEAVCVCVSSRSLKRWSFDLFLYSVCVQALLAERLLTHPISSVFLWRLQGKAGLTYMKMMWFCDINMCFCPFWPSFWIILFSVWTAVVLYLYMLLSEDSEWSLFAEGISSLCSEQNACIHGLVLIFEKVCNHRDVSSNICVQMSIPAVYYKQVLENKGVVMYEAAVV